MLPANSEAGSNVELADRVKSILASKQLTLHQASQKSAILFGRESAYYLPHNLYYDLLHGHLSPSLFQLVAFSRISSYRLRDWLRVFGFDIEAVPRLQIQLASKRTSLLESSFEDPTSRIPWFRNVRSGSSPLGVVPMSHIVEWAGLHRSRPLLELNDIGSVYARIGREDALAFPELLQGSIVRVNPRNTSEALKRINPQGSANLFLIRHAKGLCCCHIRAAGHGRIGTISTQLPYAEMEFRVPEQARIIGPVDLEIRSLVGPQLPPVPKALAKRWEPDALSPEPSQLGPLLRRARLEIGLSFRAASAMSRELADLLGDERYFTASGSLSDYETLNTPPRHFHKIVTFCVVYSLPLHAIFQSLNLSLEEPGQEPIPDWLTSRSLSPLNRTAELDRTEESGFIRGLLTEIGGAPLFLRRSISALSGLAKPSLKDFFWMSRTANTVHPHLVGGVLAVVNRQRKKTNDCRSKPLWQQPLYVFLKRDGTYMCGCCSQENGSFVIHSYPDGLHKRQQFRHKEVEVIGKIVAVMRKLA